MAPPDLQKDIIYYAPFLTLCVHARARMCVCEEQFLQFLISKIKTF
jgi:hypothetical protein